MNILKRVLDNNNKNIVEQTQEAFDRANEINNEIRGHQFIIDRFEAQVERKEYSAFINVGIPYFGASIYCDVYSLACNKKINLAKEAQELNYKLSSCVSQLSSEEKIAVVNDKKHAYIIGQLPFTKEEKESGVEEQAQITAVRNHPEIIKNIKEENLYDSVRMEASSRAKKISSQVLLEQTISNGRSEYNSGK